MRKNHTHRSLFVICNLKGWSQWKREFIWGCTQSKAKKTKHVCRAWMWYQKKGVITMESYSTFTKPIHFTSKHKWGRCSMAFLLPFATHAHIRTQNGNWMPFSYHLIVYWRIFFLVVHFLFQPYDSYRWRQHEQKCPLLCLDCNMWHIVSWKILDHSQRAYLWNKITKITWKFQWNKSLHVCSQPESNLQIFEFNKKKTRCDEMVRRDAYCDQSIIVIFLVHFHSIPYTIYVIQPILLVLTGWSILCTAQ